MRHVFGVSQAWRQALVVLMMGLDIEPNAAACRRRGDVPPLFSILASLLRFLSLRRSMCIDAGPPLAPAARSVLQRLGVFVEVVQVLIVRCKRGAAPPRGKAAGAFAK